jgi:hypothetical protein
MIVYLPFSLNQLFWLGVLLGMNLAYGLFLFIHGIHEVLKKRQAVEKNYLAGRLMQERARRAR